MPTRGVATDEARAPRPLDDQAGRDVLAAGRGRLRGMAPGAEGRRCSRRWSRRRSGGGVIYGAAGPQGGSGERTSTTSLRRDRPICSQATAARCAGREAVGIRQSRLGGGAGARRRRHRGRARAGYVLGATSLARHRGVKRALPAASKVYEAAAPSGPASSRRRGDGGGPLELLVGGTAPRSPWQHHDCLLRGARGLRAGCPRPDIPGRSGPAHRHRHRPIRFSLAEGDEVTIAGNSLGGCPPRGGVGRVDPRRGRWAVVTGRARGSGSPPHGGGERGWEVAAVTSTPRGSSARGRGERRGRVRATRRVTDRTGVAATLRCKAGGGIGVWQQRRLGSPRRPETTEEAGTGCSRATYRLFSDAGAVLPG